MSNAYYTPTGWPAQATQGVSALGRAELALVAAGFDKLPVFTANANKAVVVNSGSTGLTVTTGTLALAGNLAIVGASAVTLTSSGATNVTLPTTGTLATLAGAEELTTKTLTASIAKGVWTASGTWTLPAHTLGGTVTSNGQSFSGTIADLGSVTTVDINGGTVDGAVIGGAAPAAGTFTTVTGTGLVDLSGAAAGQIKFPATQNASANVNTLDDYKEGTWTPVLAGDLSHSPGGYFTQKGKYTKVGNRIDWSVELQINGYGTLANGEGLFITGFPFTPGSGATYPGQTTGNLSGSGGIPLTAATWPHVRLAASDPTLFLLKTAAEASLLKQDVAANQIFYADGRCWV